MRKILLILGLIFLFTACEKFDSLPEPELPVEEIEMLEAIYNPPPEHSISIHFQVPVMYDQIYQYYNMSGIFSMAPYLKDRDFDIIETKLRPYWFDIYLSADKAVPEKLLFNTQEPMYFSYPVDIWNNVIIAKGFIKTQELSVP